MSANFSPDCRHTLGRNFHGRIREKGKKKKRGRKRRRRRTVRSLTLLGMGDGGRILGWAHTRFSHFLENEFSKSLVPPFIALGAELGKGGSHLLFRQAFFGRVEGSG